MPESSITPPDGAPDDPPAAPADERIPVMQQLLDNHFLLLFLGVTIPTIFYLMWGVMEVANIPIAK